MRRTLLLVALLAAGCGGNEPKRDEPRPAQRDRPPRAIRAADIREHLVALEAIAKRSGGNRAAGTAGERRTADYIAEQLRASGWRVREQAVRWPIFENRRRPVLGGLRYRRDFEELEYSGSASLTATVQARDTRACRASELGRLTRTDVVVVARGTCPFREKALNAQRAGAGALVVVDRRARRPVPGTLGDPAQIRIPVLSATGDAAARLARRREVRIVVDSISETRTTRNVLADNGGAGRVVMAGGHLDSVEEGPGINDNASGVAALLELAERLRDGPRVRLGFWTAEELGLFGSRHYVRTLPRAERRRIRAYVNVDLVATKKAGIQVYDTDDTVERTLRRAIDGREDETDVGGASDHAPFDRARIPVGGLITGTDRCYHRRCDALRNADPAVAAEVARATQAALSELAR